MNALLVIDMLNDYLRASGTLYCKTCTSIIKHVKTAIGISRKNKVKVIYACENHEKNNSYPIYNKWPVHAVNGTWGAEIIREIRPHQNDIIVHKHCYSAFFETELQKVLKKYKVSNIYITGIHTHVCVLSTALGAFYRGYNVFVVKECVMSSERKKHLDHIQFIRSHIGEVITLKKFNLMLKMQCL